MSQTGQVVSQLGHASALPLHSHREPMLIVDLRGTMTIGTGDQTNETWALAPHGMLWLAGGTPHHVRTTADHHWLALAFPPALVARPTCTTSWRASAARQIQSDVVALPPYFSTSSRSRSPRARASAALPRS